MAVAEGRRGSTAGAVARASLRALASASRSSSRRRRSGFSESGLGSGAVAMTARVRIRASFHASRVASPSSSTTSSSGSRSTNSRRAGCASSASRLPTLLRSTNHGIAFQVTTSLPRSMRASRSSCQRLCDVWSSLSALTNGEPLSPRSTSLRPGAWSSSRIRAPIPASVGSNHGTVSSPPRCSRSRSTRAFSGATCGSCRSASLRSSSAGSRLERGSSVRGPRSTCGEPRHGSRARPGSAPDMSVRDIRDAKKPGPPWGSERPCRNRTGRETPHLRQLRNNSSTGRRGEQPSGDDARRYSSSTAETTTP